MRRRLTFAEKKRPILHKKNWSMDIFLGGDPDQKQQFFCWFPKFPTKTKIKKKAPIPIF